MLARGVLLSLCQGLDAGTGPHHVRPVSYTCTHHFPLYFGWTFYLLTYPLAQPINRTTMLVFGIEELWALCRKFVFPRTS